MSFLYLLLLPLIELVVAILNLGSGRLGQEIAHASSHPRGKRSVERILIEPSSHSRHYSEQPGCPHDHECLSQTVCEMFSLLKLAETNKETMYSCNQPIQSGPAPYVCCPRKIPGETVKFVETFIDYGKPMVKKVGLSMAKMMMTSLSKTEKMNNQEAFDGLEDFDMFKGHEVNHKPEPEPEEEPDHLLSMLKELAALKPNQYE